MNFTLIRENIVIMAYIGLISSKFLINYYVVIIFVIDAISLLLSASLEYKILPLLTSITTVDKALSAKTFKGIIKIANIIIKNFVNFKFNHLINNMFK